MVNHAISSKFAVVVSLLLLLASCQQQAGPDGGTPFIGGQKGVEVGFEPNAPPSETFDGGQAPFDVAVRLRNLGEYALPKDKVKVTIQGLQPDEFGKSSNDLVKNPQEELEPRRKDVQGNVVESNVVVTNFEGLNHRQPITGTALTFPVRAQVCYQYGTIAASQLCARSDILNPRAGGICELSGSKQVFNSGAPIQVQEIIESPRAQDKIGFTFKIVHVDSSGRLFEKSSSCDTSQRRFEDRVFVDVRSPLGNVECSGLTGGSQPNNGFVQLFEKTKTVTCTQDVRTRGDYTFPITIELTYDFQSEANTQIVVKRSEVGSR